MLNRIQSARAVIANAADRLIRPDSLVSGGKTPFDVIHTDGLVSIRHYQPDASAPRQHAVPLVIVPPLAVNTLIYDWFPDRSLIAYLLEQGFNVYLLDWGSPNRRHAHYSLATYVGTLMPELLGKVRAHAGEEQLSLHGWSMGGGFVLCYLGFTGDTAIRNIVTVGTAVNGHANGQIGKQYKMFGRWLKRLRLDVRRIPDQIAYSPAWVNAVGFKLSDPVSSVQGYVDLLKNLSDREFVARHANQSAFMDRLEAYPGAVIRDWMYSVWLENEASRGQFSVGRKTIYLRDIKANLLCVAGDRDTLANRYACEPLMEMVSSEDKTFLLAPGGHTGIVSGPRAPAQVWPQVAQWLGERSD